MAVLEYTVSKLYSCTAWRRFMIMTQIGFLVCMESGPSQSWSRASPGQVHASVCLWMFRIDHAWWSHIQVYIRCLRIYYYTENIIEVLIYQKKTRTQYCIWLQHVKNSTKKLKFRYGVCIVKFSTVCLFFDKLVLMWYCLHNNESSDTWCIPWYATIMRDRYGTSTGRQRHAAPACVSGLRNAWFPQTPRENLHGYQD
jgi:hypothetical protein